MKYTEIVREGYYAIADDSLVMRHLDDTRRPKLTLRHLHDLRLSNEFSKKGKVSRLAMLPTIYNPPGSE